jgi:hypothetical protein
VVIGMPKLNFIDENIAIAKRFEPMAPAEMRSLSDRLAADHKARLDLFFSDHTDC